MQLYNSLTQKKEGVKGADGAMGMYTCGPTVYSYVSIGNWRTYVLGDVLCRSLGYLGHEVDYVMNITDVGHLTGDNEGDADTGEDRLEKAAKREGKTAWDVAEFYTRDFLEGFDALGMIKPRVFAKATDHIDEQIALIQKIEQAGYVYRISDGMYFDVAAYEKDGHGYGVLSTLDQIKEGARVSKNDEKRDGRDFALWKFNMSGAKRDMEWESPWGVGFPGWHIECSAMGMKYLGEQFEIHVGGEDLRSTHHPNEIAQSEAATSRRPFVKHWVHGAFLMVDGGRMGKSKGNAYTLADIREKGFDPLALRYFYFTGHYRKQLNFTWEGLEAASQALGRLRSAYASLGDVTAEDVSEHPYANNFADALSDDLSLPRALAVAWEVVKAGDLPDGEKKELLDRFDDVLGLGLGTDTAIEVSDAARALLVEREEARLKRDYERADALREELGQMGYRIEDGAEGAVLKKG